MDTTRWLATVRRVLTRALALSTLVGGMALPVTARAAVVTLNPSQLLQLRDVFETPGNAATTLSSKPSRGERPPVRRRPLRLAG